MRPPLAEERGRYIGPLTPPSGRVSDTGGAGLAPPPRLEQLAAPPHVGKKELLEGRPPPAPQWDARQLMGRYGPLPRRQPPVAAASGTPPPLPEIEKRRCGFPRRRSPFWKEAPGQQSTVGMTDTLKPTQ